MVTNRPPSAHWTSYRPAHDGKHPPRLQRDSSSRWPPDFEADPRAAPSSAPLGSRRERSNRSREPSYRRRRENSYRRRRETSYYSPRGRSYFSQSRSRSPRSQCPSPAPAVTKVHAENNGGKKEKKAKLLWPAELDDLMGRTGRAFDLVVNYERDSNGGKRWAADAIDVIRKEGKKSLERIAKLKAWAHDPERAKAKPAEIAEDIRLARMHCEYIQRMIGRSENNLKGENLYLLQKEREAEAKAVEAEALYSEAKEAKAAKQGDEEDGDIEWKIKGQAEAKNQKDQAGEGARRWKW